MAIIAISRGTFTGGQTLAERLAERLGYQCLGREELLEAAVAAYGIPVEKLRAAMDKPPSLWERLVSDRDIYLNYVRAMLCERVRGDNLVFHSFVGHLLLPGISHVIRVRVIEDMESRIEAAVRRHHLERKDAIARIKKIDRERSEWTRFLWGVDWQDPSLYDAVINLSRMGISGACELVAHMVELEAFKPTPQSLKAMEDLALGSRVWAALAMDSAVMGAGLKVEADDGVVTITGTVGSWEMVDAIPWVARRVEGVKEVRCNVEVAAPIYEPPI